MSFIFFTAFAFLNMLIGIIVNVMDDENQKVRAQSALDVHEPTIKDVYLKLEALEAQLQPRDEQKEK
jgi:voltage-gated sodium channel